MLVCIIGYVVIRGIRNVNLTFLTTVTSAIRQTTGIAGNIVNTLYIVVLTLLIATPIGIGSAIYLNEYAKGGKLVRLIEFTTETLSGIRRSYSVCLVWCSLEQPADLVIRF